MYRNLIATGASAALAAAVLSAAAATAGAVTFPDSPKAAVTPARATVTEPGTIALKIRTSACVTRIQAAAESRAHPGTHWLSTISDASGKAFTVTLKIPAGEPAGPAVVYSVTGRACADKAGGFALLPAKGGTFAVFTIVSPAPAPLPGSGKQEG